MWYPKIIIFLWRNQAATGNVTSKVIGPGYPRPESRWLAGPLGPGLSVFGWHSLPTKERAKKELALEFILKLIFLWLGVVLVQKIQGVKMYVLF